MSGRPLDREEYIEQAYCFRTFRERLDDNTPAQEILRSLSEELLATTNLPKAVDFLRGEILHAGRISPGMARLSHYFTPFQTFVMSRAEEERSRFDQKTALLALERLAEYLAGMPTPAGLFIYQFECIARNRLGYDRGMKAIADDPFYDKTWRDWILKARLRLGTTDFGQLIYYRSEQYLAERRKRTPAYKPSYPILFSVQEDGSPRPTGGRIRCTCSPRCSGKSAIPRAPRLRAKEPGPIIHPALEQRLQRIETRLKILDSEVKGEFDLSEYYVKPEAPGGPEQQPHVRWRSVTRAGRRCPLCYTWWPQNRLRPVAQSRSAAWTSPR